MHNGDYMSFHTNGAGSGTSNERLRITSGGQIFIGGNIGWNESSSLLSIATDAAAGANMLGDSSAIYNHNNPAFIHVQNRYNTGTGQEAGIIFHSRSSYNGSWAIYGKRTSSNYLSDLIFRNRTGSGSSAERLRIDSNGRLLVNNSSSTSPDGFNSLIQVNAANHEGGITIGRHTANANGPALIFQKSRSGTATPGNGVLSSGDVIGTIRYYGSDGTDRNSFAASISCEVDGTPGSNDMPGRLVFLTTADGASTSTERLRITSTGETLAKTLAGNYYPVASARDGSTSARAAQSAWEIKKTLGPAARTGYYYLINPYDSTTSQWWCDMETDGGGWVLIAHTGDGGMSDQGTNGTHWWSRSNKGGFDTVGAGYYAGGGYWRASNGSWGENTNGQLMWDVRTHYSEFDHQSNDKVVFNWGTNSALPSGNSGQSNIPGASSRRFNEWCYPVVNAPGFNPMNYDNNVRSNIISGANHFTEHMVMTWSFRNTSGNADNGENGPYWMIGSHAAGLHQHYEESLSGDSSGDGSYQVVSNEDTGWGGGGTNNGYRRIAREASSGTCNVWLR